MSDKRATYKSKVTGSTKTLFVGPTVGAAAPGVTLRVAQGDGFSYTSETIVLSLEDVRALRAQLKELLHPKTRTSGAPPSVNTNEEPA